MGFWSGLTGSDTGSTTEQTSKTNQTQTQKGTTNVAGSATQTSLDQGTIDLLTGVIGNLGGNLGAGSADANSIRALLPELISSVSPEMINGAIDAAQKSAEQSFRLGEGTNIKGLQQQIGSKGNTFSALIEQQGNVDLATNLGKIAADTTLQGAQLRGQNIAQAIGGYGAASQVSQAPIDNFLSAIKVLEGAKVTQENKQTSTQDQLATLIADTFSKSRTSGSTSMGLVPTFTSLFGQK